jgi:tetratricopeptide (TPR) repeat protein
LRLVELAAPGGRSSDASTLVAREDELALLLSALGRAVSQERCVLFTLVGAPGVGKSRVVLEFLERAQGTARVLEGRALPYGDGVTYWPLAEAIRQGLRIGPEADASEVRAAIATTLEGDPDAERIGALIAQILGVGEDGAAGEEIFWAVRRFVEALASTSPLVVVIDDVQWAEPTLLDLVASLAERIVGFPVLLLCVGRPELLEHRPTWGSAADDSTTLRLEPLTADESGLLLTTLLGGVIGPRDTAAIVRAAGGNPLFMEETVAMLREEGTLRREGDGWRTDGLEHIAVPPAIQALLASRIDRLPDDERAVLERAALIGQDFQGSALQVLTEDLDVDLEGALERLVRRDLVRPRRRVAERDAYAFRHLLLRDVAEERLPLRVRADLHARFGSWIAATAGDRLPEVEAIAGYHLERAVTELRLLGEDDLDLAARGSTHLQEAGRRAADRSDMRAAAALLGRAAALLPPEDRHRLELDLERVDALHEMGELETTERLLGDAVARASSLGDPTLETSATLALAFTRIYTDYAGSSHEAVLRDIRAAASAFEALGDEERLARAYRVMAAARWGEPDLPAALDAFELALEYARRAGSVREEEVVLSQMPSAWLWDDTPADDALLRAEEILRAPPSRRVEAKCGLVVAGLLAMRGRFDDARAALDASRSLHEDLGMGLSLASGSQVAALVEQLAGLPEAAERELRDGLRALEAIGDEGLVATTLCFLARAVFEQGRLDEADELTRRAEASSGDEDLIGQADWATTRARVLGARGAAEEAAPMLHGAIAAYGRAGMTMAAGDARTDLAIVLASAGRADEAVAAARAALEEYRRKAVVPREDAARSLLTSVQA